MKVTKLFAAVLLAVGVCFAPASNAKSDKGAMHRNAQKSGEERGEPLQLNVDIAFSRQWGETVTDENGTTYNFFGMSCFEPKIYPLEYWGVFPLYFFGGKVGIGVTVKNECATQVASLRITSECYCLNTDGSNGAQLLAPQETKITINGNETKTVDASFVGEYVEGADSGLDRFLVKLFHDSSAIYAVKRDQPNTIKFGEPDPLFGEGGALEKDTFVVYVTGGSGPVQVTTKAGNASTTTTLTSSGDSALDALGFRVTLEQLEVETYEDSPPPPLPGQPAPIWEPTVTTNAAYTLSISSVGNRHALSHVVFAFGGNSQVIWPEEGEYEANRETLDGESSSLILVKEGVFCPPKLDAELTALVESIIGGGESTAVPIAPAAITPSVPSYRTAITITGNVEASILKSAPPPAIRPELITSVGETLSNPQANSGPADQVGITIGSTEECGKETLSNPQASSEPADLADYPDVSAYEK